jgi:hypothetical protein
VRSWIFFLLLVVGCNHAAKVERQPANTDNELGIDVEGLIQRLPTETMRRAIREYASMLGQAEYENSGVNGANEGVAAWNQHLLRENPCFRQLATRFYSEVHRRDQGHPPDGPPIANFVELIHIGLNMGNQQGVEAGHLWDLAMDFSGQNPNLAINLIGICGHDNSNQVYPMDCLPVVASEHRCEQAEGVMPFETPEQAQVVRQSFVTHAAKL